MKKFIVIFVVAAFFCATRENSNRQKAEETRLPARTAVEMATTEDGRIDLSILLDSNIFPEERREAFREADLDADGFLTPEEYDAMPDEFARKWRKEYFEVAEAQARQAELNWRLTALYWQSYAPGEHRRGAPF